TTEQQAGGLVARARRAVPLVVARRALMAAADAELMRTAYRSSRPRARRPGRSLCADVEQALLRTVLICDPRFHVARSARTGSRAPDRVPSGPVWCQVDTWWCQQREGKN